MKLQVLEVGSMTQGLLSGLCFCSVLFCSVAIEGLGSRVRV